MQGKVRCTQIDDTTWRFQEQFFGTPVYLYLLVGREKALLIDTGYGFTDVPRAIRAITPLPLLVINTHGHLDHTHGNHLYPQVMLHPADREVFLRHSDYEENMLTFRNLLKGTPIPGWLFPVLRPLAGKAARAYPSHTIDLPPQMALELGDRPITIVETPGHTPGSISLLDEKNRWLFCGDMGCKDGVLLNLPESTSLSVFAQSMEKMDRLAVTALFPGHQQSPLGPEILKAYREACDLLRSRRCDPEALQRGVFTHQGIRLEIGERSVS